LTGRKPRNHYATGRSRHRGHEQDIADDLLQTLGEHVNEALAFEGSSNRESKGSTRRAKNS
jgi:hypothetical protein